MTTKLTREQKQELYDKKEWYTIRSLLGNTWARYFMLIGARERGKSYSVQEFCLTQKIEKDIPFYWMRLNEAATGKMLKNNGAKMFEPLLVKQFGLEDIKVKGTTVFKDDKVLCEVLALSTAYNDKGSALFDQSSFKGCNIIIDEFQLEKGQKRTFDVVYNLKMQIENICRSHSENVRVFFIGNNTEECSDVLALFNFIPLEFGVYKLKSRHLVIDYIPNSKAYTERRKHAIANDLDNGTGNFTNKVKRDITLITKKRLFRPGVIIKFSKEEEDWFTVWDGNIVHTYNKEKLPVRAMRRYIDEQFDVEARDSIIDLADARALQFTSLIVQTRFYYQLSLIKKQ